VIQAFAQALPVGRMWTNVREACLDDGIRWWWLSLRVQQTLKTELILPPAKNVSMSLFLAKRIGHPPPGSMLS
jgi:hypothetical protein